MTRWIGNIRIGWLWSCPWRIEWARRCEYWWRYQLGPLYALQYRTTEDAPQEQP